MPLFMISVNYELRISIDLLKENGLTRKNADYITQKVHNLPLLQQ